MNQIMSLRIEDPALGSGGAVPIAAVIYGQGDGARADTVLSAVADELASQGMRLSGAVQFNTHNGDRCRCDMMLKDLATGRRVEISEFRGPEARGCRLNPVALEEIVGHVCASLEHGADLLIINKFGKREAEGRGFRQPIELALSYGIPVLVAVNEEHLHDWRSFADGLDCMLPLDAIEILCWCANISPPGTCTANRRTLQSRERAGQI